MRSDGAAARDIDEYIAGFPADVQKILERIRRTIRKAAPAAKETISYRIPAFTLQGHLVYFAAFKGHVGLYPTSLAMKKSLKDLSAYESGKGTARFPLDQPIPYGLIARMVKFRVKENAERAASKGKKR
jgi:uncharacterized protein YdhG (YjbR/CyaY superfamily)